MNYKIFNTKESAAGFLAEALFQKFQSADSEVITVAISGGTTPFILFEVWATQYSQKINWQKIHFFWVDERCVPYDSAESNYGNTKKVLFDKINIPQENIHRMRGEDSPEVEAVRYADEIMQFVPLFNGIPQFDILLLGMGDDGHTASIFPHQLSIMDLPEVVAVAQNPYSGQQRLTLTGKVLNNAQLVYFLVTGGNKTEVLKQIFEKHPGADKYPAAWVKPVSDNLTWILDTDAATFLSKPIE